MNPQQPFNYPHGHPNHPGIPGGQEMYQAHPPQDRGGWEQSPRGWRHGRSVEFASDNAPVEHIARHAGGVILAEAIPHIDEAGNTTYFNAIQDAGGNGIVLRGHLGKMPDGVLIRQNAFEKPTRDQQAAINRHNVAKKMKAKPQTPMQGTPPRHVSNTQPPSQGPLRQNFGNQAPIPGGAFDFNQPSVGGFGPQKGATQEFLAQQAAKQPQYPAPNRRPTAVETGDDYFDPKLGLSSGTGRSSSRSRVTRAPEIKSAAEPDEELAPWQPGEQEAWRASDEETRAADQSFEEKTYGVHSISGRPGSQRKAETEAGAHEPQVGAAIAAATADIGVQVDPRFQAEALGDDVPDIKPQAPRPAHLRDSRHTINEDDEIRRRLGGMGPGVIGSDGQ